MVRALGIELHAVPGRGVLPVDRGRCERWPRRGGLPLRYLPKLEIVANSMNMCETKATMRATETVYEASISEFASFLQKE